MMVQHFFALYDSDVGYMQPFACANAAVALRSLKNECESPVPNQLQANCQAISLWSVADFDDETGVFTENKKKIADAAPFVLAFKASKEVNK